MENLSVILSATATILGFIAVVVTFVIKLVKLIRANTSFGQSAELCNMLLPLIQEAEKLLDMSGAQKKEYVLTKVEDFATENDFKFFDADFISKKIDEIISLTKNVNIK